MHGCASQLEQYVLASVDGALWQLLDYLASVEDEWLRSDAFLSHATLHSTTISLLLETTWPP